MTWHVAFKFLMQSRLLRLQTEFVRDYLSIKKPVIIDLGPAWTPPPQWMRDTYPSILSLNLSQSLSISLSVSSASSLALSFGPSFVCFNFYFDQISSRPWILSG